MKKFQSHDAGIVVEHIGIFIHIIVITQHAALLKNRIENCQLIRVIKSIVEKGNDHSLTAEIFIVQVLSIQHFHLPGRLSVADGCIGEVCFFLKF